jgi:hypothetical protein
MSHLHRQLAANAAIAADKETQHPCTPTVVGEGAPKASAKARAPKKAKGRRRGKA